MSHHDFLSECMDEGHTLNDRTFREQLTELLTHKFIEKSSSKGREHYRLPAAWSTQTIKQQVIGRS